VPVVSYGSLKPTGKQEQAGRSNLSQRDKPRWNRLTRSHRVPTSRATAFVYPWPTVV